MVRWIRVPGLCFQNFKSRDKESNLFLKSSITGFDKFWFYLSLAYQTLRTGAVMLWWPKPELHSTQALVAEPTMRIKTALAETWIQLVPPTTILFTVTRKRRMLSSNSKTSLPLNFRKSWILSQRSCGLCPIFNSK